MYAVADIHFRKNIDLVALFRTMPISSPQIIQDVIAKTVFSLDPATAGAAVYANLSRSVYLVFHDGPQQLQVHFECPLTAGSVVEIKSGLEKVVGILSDSAKSSKQKLNSIVITIFAENNRITTGVYSSFLRSLFNRFRETIIGDALFAVVPAIVGGFYSGDVKLAAVTLAGSVVVIFIWLCIEADKLRKKVSYEDV